MFRIVLVEPEIPPNTGNIIRLTANVGCELHLIEPLGFDFEDRHMRRAGLDYHEYASLKRHANWLAFLESEQPKIERMFTLTTKGISSFYDKKYQCGDWFVFGCETRGLPEVIRNQFSIENRVRLPMREGQRSLNLSNSVAITAYEVWHQLGFLNQHT
jgi:tRNA (cytidine/uridine-2'-O-)-methyltransferase